MKLNIDRKLVGGKYTVRFRAGDFSEEERERFTVFGAPEFTLPLKEEGGLVYRIVALPNLHFYRVEFDTPEEAETFETQLLTEISERMDVLRERKDTYSGSTDLDI